MNKLSADILPWAAQNYVNSIYPPKNPNKPIQFLQGCGSTEGQMLQSWGERLKHWEKKIHDSTYIWDCNFYVFLQHLCTMWVLLLCVSPFSDSKKSPKNKNGILRTFNWCINISDIFWCGNLFHHFLETERSSFK